MKDDPTKQYTLFIVRGAPGSGKTHLARTLAPSAHFAADDWFHMRAQEEGKTYEEFWSPDHLSTAHDWCADRVRCAMDACIPRVAVHNTFPGREFVTPYLLWAEQRGYMPSIVVCCNDYGNQHGVPDNRVREIRDSIDKSPMLYRRR